MEPPSGWAQGTSETVDTQEPKTRLSHLIARAETGEEIIIAGANRPVVRLVPGRETKAQCPSVLQGRLPGLQRTLGRNVYRPHSPQGLASAFATLSRKSAVNHECEVCFGGCRDARRHERQISWYVPTPTAGRRRSVWSNLSTQFHKYANVFQLKGAITYSVFAANRRGRVCGHIVIHISQPARLAGRPWRGRSRGFAAARSTSFGGLESRRPCG
jgi:prevent-host-death family protein